MDGDFLELLFIAAFILFGLLGGRKKKRPPTPVPRPRPDTRMPADRTAVRRPTSRGPATQQERLLRELEGLLTGKPVRPEPEVESATPSMQQLPDPAEARSLEPVEVDEASDWEIAKQRTAEVTEGWRAGRARAAESLETLEGAGEASHKRFHALYDQPAQATGPRRTVPSFPTGEMRRAFVWSEILGPPVSER